MTALPARLGLLAAALLGCDKSTVQPLVPRLATPPQALTFALTAYAATSVLPLPLTAVSPVAVTVSSVRFDGPDAAVFAVSPAAPLVVPGGQSLSLQVTFAPPLPQPVPAGTRSYRATLTLSSDDPQHPTFSVALQGSAAAPQLDVCWIADGGASSCLSQGPVTVEFGSIAAGQQGAAQEIDLKAVSPVPLTVSALGLDAAATAAGYRLLEVAQLPLQLSAQTGTTAVFHLALTPAAAGPAPGKLQVVSNDPSRSGQPVSVDLDATVQAAQGPIACLGVSEIDYLDGRVATPDPAKSLADQPAIVPPGPLDSVVVTAQVSARCSFDAQDGQNLSYTFALAPPAGSTAALTPVTGHPEERRLQLDLSGNYLISLQATDSAHLSANQSLALGVAPQSDLDAQLTWDGGLANLDLHLVRQLGDAGTLPLLADPENDCFFCNCVQQVNTHTCGSSYPALLNWAGLSNPTLGNPLLVASQLYQPFPDRQLDEVRLESPQPGAAYGLYAHYYQVRLGGQAAAQAQLQIFVDGQPALDGGPLTQLLAAPCALWHAADVQWLAGGHLLDGGYLPPKFQIVAGATATTLYGAANNGVCDEPRL